MNNLNSDIFKFIIRTRNPAISQRNLNVGVKPTRRENLLYKAKAKLPGRKIPSLPGRNIKQTLLYSRPVGRRKTSQWGKSALMKDLNAG